MSLPYEVKHIAPTSNQVETSVKDTIAISEESTWAKLSETFITGSLIAGILCIFIKNQNKVEDFKTYLPYFLTSAITLPVSHQIVKPWLAHIGTHFFQGSTAFQIAEDTTELINTFTRSMFRTSVSQMLKIEKGEDIVANLYSSYYDILIKSLAYGAIPKFYTKLAKCEFTNISYETLTSFSNQLIRQGLKAVGQNTIKENNYLLEIANSINKSLLLKESIVPTLKRLSDTFIYDIADLNCQLYKSLGQLEDYLSLKKSNFINEIVANSITEISEPYLDILTLDVSQKLYSLFS